MTNKLFLVDNSIDIPTLHEWKFNFEEKKLSTIMKINFFSKLETPMHVIVLCLVVSKYKHS